MTGPDYQKEMEQEVARQQFLQDLEQNAEPGTPESGDPVYQDKDGKWRYCDETWNDSGDGPFSTREEAEEALQKYARYLDTGKYE